MSSVDDTRDLKVPQKVGYVNVLSDFGGPESIGVREVQTVSYFMFMGLCDDTALEQSIDNSSISAFCLHPRAP